VPSNAEHIGYLCPDEFLSLTDLGFDQIYQKKRWLFWYFFIVG
jgi:hypothetical protein